MNESTVRRIERTIAGSLLGAKKFESACLAAREEGCWGVCVPSSRVSHAYHLLGESDLKVTCLIGFPLGEMDPDVKRFETEAAVDNGAQEIEVVMNLARFQDGDHSFVLRELRDIVEAANDLPVKIMVEAGLWTDEELRLVCKLVLESGAKFISSSTGLNGSAPNPSLIRKLREWVGPDFGLKASGLPDFNSADSWVLAGANRLGNAPGRH